MAFFLRRVRDHAEAEDLTQEVFSRLTAQSDRPVQSGTAYLFQIAANLLKDRARRARIRANYQAMLAEGEDKAVDALDPFRIAAGRDSVAAIRAALDELPDDTGTIFVLYRMENMSKEVIADSFGISIRSVERHLTRAMAHLIERFGKSHA
jgi:RNA polymerase sigma factor (sigma-70 family)